MKCCKQNEKSKVEFSLDGLICYCFSYSKNELFEAIKSGSENKIVDDIKSKMNNPGCFCEQSNPSGKCCLSDIMTFIHHYK